MRLLLDTHALLWFAEGNEKLGRRARDLIEDEANIRLLSVASAWEIAIKVGLGKLQMAVPFADLIPGFLDRNGIVILPIRTEHLEQVIGMPLHHKDPFDRMLVAQARVESAVLLSADVSLDAYGVARIW